MTESAFTDFLEKFWESDMFYLIPAKKAAIVHGGDRLILDIVGDIDVFDVIAQVSDDDSLVSK